MKKVLSCFLSLLLLLSAGTFCFAAEEDPFLSDKNEQLGDYQSDSPHVGVIWLKNYSDYVICGVTVKGSDNAFPSEDPLATEGVELQPGEDTQFDLDYDVKGDSVIVTLGYMSADGVYQHFEYSPVPAEEICRDYVRYGVSIEENGHNSLLSCIESSEEYWSQYSSEQEYDEWAEEVAAAQAEQESEFFENVRISVENNRGGTITQVYLKQHGVDDWGPNLLSGDHCIPNGRRCGLDYDISYTEGTCWDFYCINQGGGYSYRYNFTFDSASNPYDITISLYRVDGEFHVSVY